MTLLRHNILSKSVRDQVLVFVLIISSLTTIALVCFIFLFLILESLPALSANEFSQWLSDPSWHPTEGQYNLYPIMIGTLAIAGGSVIITTPIGIASAIFLHYYAPTPVAIFFRRIIELLAGIPSVIYGFWGLVVLVPVIIQIAPPGQSVLAGIIVLSMMTLPIITLATETALICVPHSTIYGGYALGLSKISVITKIILPQAKPGIVSGVFLQTGRAIGETMVVLMVCGNVIQIPDSILDPARTLTANIALEMAYATDIHRSSLFVTGLMLLLSISCLTVINEFFKKNHHARTL
ncbi:MAG: phosphate ABC transporter permease subunit PstC [Methylococcales bacterium]|jgi:phosphate transport system permease protein|nr:phosphate ABC transporter permease subunit PstC [Methylococcales bacterium]MBT7410987.1 phosphate ABC transporter permease subunit PstC [Methylococcales bacterium]